MTTQNTKSRPRRPDAEAPGSAPPEEVVDRLAGLLPAEELERALEGLEPERVTGPGGLVSQLAGRVIETAHGAELSEHLGYPPGEAPPGGAGNHRNGSTRKTVQTEVGPVAVKTPRDRKGSFEPKLVAKRQTRLAGLDERILGLDAGGMSVRDIAQHVSDLYGTEIGRDTISRVTDAVLEHVATWRTRPLEAAYPIIYFDCLLVKVREDRSSPRLLPGGRRLGRGRARAARDLVAGQGGREVLAGGAQRRAAARRQGRADLLGRWAGRLPEAIEAVFPKVWVQTCIVHQIRVSMRYVAYRDRKAVARDLKPVYRAVNADAAWEALETFDQTWGERYPMIVESWRARWEHITPFLALPAELRRAVYTTDERFKVAGVGTSASRSSCHPADAAVRVSPWLPPMRTARGRPRCSAKRSARTSTAPSPGLATGTR